MGHSLAGLTRQAERAIHALEDDSRLAHRLLVEIVRQLAELTVQVRGLAHQLFPPELEVLGLVGALRERAQSHAGLQVDVDAPAHVPPLPAETEAAVYFIALEALTNVEKHAGARCCRVQLRWTHSEKQPGTLELDVVDDGTGLSSGAPSGLGLLSMQARAAEAGGRCWIETPAGGGTAVHVRMPCPAMSEEARPWNRSAS